MTSGSPPGVSVARLAAVKPQGWVHAALERGSVKPFTAELIVTTKRYLIYVIQ